MFPSSLTRSGSGPWAAVASWTAPSAAAGMRRSSTRWGPGGWAGVATPRPSPPPPPGWGGAGVLAGERAPEAIAAARARLGEDRIRYSTGPFGSAKVLGTIQTFRPDRILLDLGVSSPQR